MSYPTFFLCSLKGEGCIVGSGPIPTPEPHWARLRFGGAANKNRWHIVVGIRSICGRQSFDYPRVERSQTRPETGKLCKFCVALPCPAMRESRREAGENAGGGE
jgi:hypothetical protein